MELVLALSVPEAARALGISRSSAWELVRSGGLPAVRLGGRVVVPVPALARLLGCDAAEVASLLRAADGTGVEALDGASDGRAERAGA